MEMILKLIALKPSGYIKSRWNIFDGVVVIISLIDTVLTLSNLIDNTGTSVLRSFRLVSEVSKSEPSPFVLIIQGSIQPWT